MIYMSLWESIKNAFGKKGKKGQKGQKGQKGRK